MDRDAPPDRRLVVVTVCVGMLAIVAMPLSAALPDAAVGRVIASVLAFATPACLIAAGRLRRRAWMMSLGATAAVVLLPLLLLNTLGGVALLSILAGPVVAALTIGLPLREVDVTAAAGFFGGGTAALVGGFALAAVGPLATIAVVAVAAGVGLAVTMNRLTHPTSA